MRSVCVLFLLVSLPAFACPKLAGVYKTCRTLRPKNNEITRMTVEQKVVNRFTEYTFSIQEVETDENRQEKYIADNKTRVSTDTDSDTGMTLRTTKTASCSGETLVITMTAKFDNEEFANMTTEVVKEGGSLVQRFKGLSLGETVNDTVVCDL